MSYWLIFVLLLRKLHYLDLGVKRLVSLFKFRLKIKNTKMNYTQRPYKMQYVLEFI